MNVFLCSSGTFLSAPQTVVRRGLHTVTGYCEADYVFIGSRCELIRREQCVSVFGNKRSGAFDKQLPQLSVITVNIRHVAFTVYRIRKAEIIRIFDGEKAQLVFGIAGIGDEHLGLLAKISEIIEDPERLEQLKTTGNVDEIMEMFK